MYIKKVIFVLFLGLLIGCNASDESKKESDSISKQKPESSGEYVEQASFTNFEGDTVGVSKYKGKVVMIDFWETWCGPCIESFPTMQKLQQEYPDNFAVLAVTPGFMDSPYKAEQFADSHDYDFDYLLDSNQLYKKLNVHGIPFKAFVDADGNFIKTEMGSEGPERDYKKIKKIIEENKTLESAKDH